MGTGAELLCQRVNPAFQELTDAVINLKFEEVCVLELCVFAVF